MPTAEEKNYCNNVIILGNPETSWNTWDITEAMILNGVPGDLAEAGVCGGGMPAIMSKVLAKHGVGGRKIHLFDSFDGIPEASPKDNELDQKTYGVNDGSHPMKSSGISRGEVYQVKNNLNQWGRTDVAEFLFHVGWFEETMAREIESVGPLALLRVDVDLYSSDYTCFKYLYPKVVQGGYVIVDDYGDYPEGNLHPPRMGMRDAIRDLGLPQPEVTHVVGSEHTVWWRKP